MQSLRSRLNVYLLVGVGLLIAAAGLTLQINTAAWLEREFDGALEAEARALRTLTRQSGGEVEFRFADESMPDFESRADPHYFELWLDGTRLLERSRSFGADEQRARAFLPKESDFRATPRFADIALPDGRLGRRVRIDFVPQSGDPGDASDQDDGPILDPTKLPPGSELRVATILVARERETLVRHARQLRWSILAFTALLTATLAALIAVALRMGLRPLDRLAGQVRALAADSLDRRVDLGAPPRELAPVVDQINGLLARLETAFRRERRLTSDIAHELRTPIAELRSLCEVGARWPGDPDLTRRFFDDARAIGLQMDRVVTHLLALARFAEGVETVAIGPVDLAAALAEAWQPLERQAREKGLRLESEVPGDAVLETDPDKFGLILSNLLSNAVGYSRPDTAIRCDFESANGRSSLAVSNYPLSLEPDDLAVMFDRFWRKDDARSGGVHSGLGLAIVRTFSEVLGLEIQTRLDPDRRFQITLSWST